MDTCVENFGMESLVEAEKDGVNDCNTIVEMISEPYVGMIFNSFQEAKTFYDDYGQSKGFATRTRSTYRDRRGPDVSSALLVCTCEGSNAKMANGEDKPKRCTIIRSGCKASMRVTNIRGTTAWKVTVFTDQHNHELFTQTKPYIVKCSKRKNPAVKTSAEAMRSCNIYQQATRLAHMAGRSEEIYEVIMAIMEETFKKVSQMEKELLNNDDYRKCSDVTSEDATNMGNGDHVIHTEPQMSTINDRKKMRKEKEMDNNSSNAENAKWVSIINREDMLPV